MTVNDFIYAIIIVIISAGIANYIGYIFGRKKSIDIERRKAYLNMNHSLRKNLREIKLMCQEIKQIELKSIGDVTISPVEFISKEMERNLDDYVMYAPQKKFINEIKAIGEPMTLFLKRTVEMQSMIKRMKEKVKKKESIEDDWKLFVDGVRDVEKICDALEIAINTFIESVKREYF